MKKETFEKLAGFMDEEHIYVGDIIAAAADEFCMNYCKYQESFRQLYDENGCYSEALEQALDDHCNECPLCRIF